MGKSWILGNGQGLGWGRWEGGGGNEVHVRQEVQDKKGLSEYCRFNLNF